MFQGLACEVHQSEKDKQLAIPGELGVKATSQHFVGTASQHARDKILLHLSKWPPILGQPLDSLLLELTSLLLRTQCSEAPFK